jgi:hypothetical protein
VTGAGGWDVDADENPLLDDDDGVRDLGEAAFERESTARPDVLSFAWDLDADGRFDDATGPTATFRGVRGPGAHPVAVRVSDGDLTSVVRRTVTVTVK